MREEIKGLLGLNAAGFDATRVLLAECIAVQYAETYARLRVEYGNPYAGWRLSHDAPSTFEALREEWHGVKYRGRPFRVSPVGLEGSIYPRTVDNVRFRYVHDFLHEEHGFTFTHEGEKAAAKRHAAMVARTAEALGYSRTEQLQIAYLLWLDTYGQAVFYRDNAGGFLQDQRATVAGWWCEGLYLDPLLKSGALSGLLLV